MLNDNKAGMDGLNKEAINKLIYDASKGSLYFESEEQKRNIIKIKISNQKLQLSKFSEAQIKDALKKTDLICNQIKSELNLSRVIVHIDMDAFYASAEILDRPDLAQHPMAVGSNSMLATSNYVARRFGVRAAMPGFIAKKLCPSLVILPPDFPKYEVISKKVHLVLQQYDANFSPVGLDEAYLDITNIIGNVFNVDKINATVEEIRTKIFEVTNLTASAGIGANGLLAKICSDKNKPNGQFYLANDQEKIMSFVENLPVRKVNGIGNVTETILKELGVITCSDLFKARATLYLLYSQNMFEFFMQIAHGVGNNYFERDSEKKSLSAERTFSEMSSLKEFIIVIKNLSEQVSDVLIEEGLECKTITLKMKTTKFEIKTRARSLQDFTNDNEIINSVALNILKHELQSQPLQLRLIGVRASTLKLSIPNKSHKITDLLMQATSNDNNAKIICPVCNSILPANTDINIHIDGCLNKDVIKEIIYTQSLESAESKNSSSNSPVKNMKNNKKRKRSLTKSPNKCNNFKISQFYKVINS